MKHFLMALLLTSVSVVVSAQERQISGVLTDKDSKEALMQVTVQLLKTDSTFVTGSLSDESGHFKVKAPSNGKYIVKFSSIGYVTLFKDVTIEKNKAVDLGNLALGADAVMLKGATVTGQATKMVVKDDTFQYNADAFRTPEGSVVEELVKIIPGAKVDDDGKITVNGKEVKKVKVDGKEFMVGDTKTAMKNLPTSIVEKIKVYDEKSDLSRVTGIDDGNEETVLDFGLRRGMNRGVFSNIDLAVGTEDRYAERLMGAYFNDKYRVMTFGSANNTGDAGFGGRGGGGRGRNGLNSSKMWGANFNYEEKDKLKLDGSVRWNHNDGDSRTKVSSENFVSRVGSFSNSLNQSYSRSDSWNAQMRFEWTPDTMTNIMFRPNISFSKNDNLSTGSSASYNDDPYLYVTDPLDYASISRLAADSLMVNTRNDNSIGYSENKRFGGMLQLNRKLNSMGRNVTLRADYNYNDTKNKNLSTSNVHLYQVLDQFGNDSTYQTNRFRDTPSKNYSYSLQTTYSEPLWKATFLQFSYKFSYNYTKSDQSTYDFSNLGEDFFAGLTPSYRKWDNWLERLQPPFDESYKDINLSRYSEYRYYTHDIEMMFRMIRESYQFNAGVMLQPQHTKFMQDYQGISVDTTRNVFNVTPTLDFRYRFSKVSNLRINYRGYTSQPDMANLVDITDDSDPLNITKGNPGLKPSFTNSLNFYYNGYAESHQKSWATFLRYNTTRNSLSNMVTYDELTGGRISQMQNINGNWDTSFGVNYNMSIDSVGIWTFNTFTEFSYRNNVGYVTLGQQTGPQKNTTKNKVISEDFTVSWRPAFGNWLLQVEPHGTFTYNNATNKLQTSNDLDTWQFAYGGTINVTTPWGTGISTDLHNRCRRGFNDSSMNTNELVWNLQISQNFLKAKNLTVSLQFYDMLDEQSNFSRALSAMSRTDTEYNSINSYALLHVIYRFNLFGGRQANQGMGPGGGRGFGGPGGAPNGGPGNRGGGMNGRPPGGFGRPM